MKNGSIVFQAGFIRVFSTACSRCERGWREITQAALRTLMIVLAPPVAGFLSTVDINKSALECIGYTGEFKDFISRLDGGK